MRNTLTTSLLDAGLNRQSALLDGVVEAKEVSMKKKTNVKAGWISLPDLRISGKTTN